MTSRCATLAMLLLGVLGCSDTTGTNGFPPDMIGANTDRIVVGADGRRYLVVLGRSDAELRVLLQPLPRLFFSNGLPAMESDLAVRRFVEIYTKRRPYEDNPLRVQADSIRIATVTGS